MSEWEKWEEELTDGAFWTLYVVGILTVLLVIFAIWSALTAAYS